MPPSATAANVLGTMGAVCWSIQLLPQIVLNHRRHNATGLQPTMMLLWALAGVPLGIYNIVNDFNLALKIQPQILTALSLLTWCQCVYYERNYSVRKCAATAGPLAVVLAGVQVGGVWALRIPERQGTEWPLIVTAVVAAGFLAAGVLRHYYDIWVFRSVRGISFGFVALDAAGDLFSLLSLLFEPTFDVLGAVIYGTELVLWIGIMGFGVRYNLASWLKGRKREREEGSGLELPGMGRAAESSAVSVFSTSGSAHSRA